MMSDIGTSGLRRLVHLTDSSRSRAVDGRWQIAIAIVSGMATRWFLRKVIDAEVSLAVRYIRQCQKDSVDFHGELADLHTAWHLRFRADLLTRSILEARLLAGLTVDETAAACELPVAAVRMYESLFFDVSCKLQHRAYIIHHAIGSRYKTGYSADDIDIVLKAVGYFQGPLFLDYILPYFTSPLAIPARLDVLAPSDLRELHKHVQIRATIEARTMSGPKAIKSYARQIAGEPATLWAALAEELRALAQIADQRIAAQARLVSAVTSLSPTSVERLVDSYRHRRPDQNSRPIPEPVRLVG
jgi:hypothetical protein